jgi:hypothetical protein
MARIPYGLEILVAVLVFALDVLPFYCCRVTAQVIQISGRSRCLRTIQPSADLIQMI